MHKAKARASKSGEEENDNDDEKNEDVRMTKRKVQRKQNGDEEVKHKE